jgi:hypothetical protein
MIEVEVFMKPDMQLRVAVRRYSWIVSVSTASALSPLGSR